MLRLLRLGWLVLVLFLLPIGWHRLTTRRDEAFVARRLRSVLQAGGVTTVKIGQYLAIRRDLFSAVMCGELSRLFDDAPALPFATVRAVIEAELGVPIDAAFASIERMPLGAASIAQVHRARTLVGDDVAIKVQRPGIAALLAADFGWLRVAARIADRSGLAGRIGAADIVAEVAAFTLRETDFRVEARTAARVAAGVGPHVRVPAIFPALTTGRVLTMDYLSGQPIARIVAATEAGDRRALAHAAPGTRPAVVVERLSEAFLRQLFVTGLFHGDPHPANVLVGRDGSVGLIDFGIFGTLAPRVRATLGDYVENLALGRFAAAYACFARLLIADADSDHAGFRRETIAILADWHATASDASAPPALRLMARYQGMIFAAMRRHGMRMAADQLLFWRALAMLDSTAQRLPVDFDMLRSIRRFFADNRPPMAERAHEAIVALGAWGSDAAPDAARAARAMLDRSTVRVAAAAGRRLGPARKVAAMLAVVALSLHVAVLT